MWIGYCMIVRCHHAMCTVNKIHVGFATTGVWCSHLMCTVNKIHAIFATTGVWCHHLMCTITI